MVVGRSGPAPGVLLEVAVDMRHLLSDGSQHNVPAGFLLQEADGVAVLVQEVEDLSLVPLAPPHQSHPLLCLGGWDGLVVSRVETHVASKLQAEVGSEGHQAGWLALAGLAVLGGEGEELELRLS